jgi:hypothetical protein
VTISEPFWYPQQAGSYLFGVVGRTCYQYYRAKKAFKRQVISCLKRMQGGMDPPIAVCIWTPLSLVSQLNESSESSQWQWATTVQYTYCTAIYQPPQIYTISTTTQHDTASNGFWKKEFMRLGLEIAEEYKWMTYKNHCNLDRFVRQYPAPSWCKDDWLAYHFGRNPSITHNINFLD